MAATTCRAHDKSFVVDLSTLDFYGTKFRDVEEIIWATVKPLVSWPVPQTGLFLFSLFQVPLLLLYYTLCSYLVIQ